MRVVHTWVALRLAIQLANPALPDDEGISTISASHSASPSPPPEWRRSVNWAIVVGALWREVNEDVTKSHGAQSAFAMEVQVFGKESELSEMMLPLAEKEREWVRLRALAQEVLT